MYLNEHNEGLDGWLSKATKKIKRAVSKAAPVIMPGAVLNARLAKRAAPALRKLSPAALVSPALAMRGKRGAVRKISQALAPLSFVPIGNRMPVPASAIPSQDYDGTDLTIEERNALIQDAEPMMDPISSGFTAPEETHAPDVPEMTQAEDFVESEVPAKKKSALPAIGGLFLLLNLLS